MDFKCKKRVLTLSLYLLFTAVSFLIGKELWDGGETLLTYVGTDEITLSNATEVFYPFCKWQMIQFVLLFVFAFTPFSSAANCAVFLARGIILGYCTGMVISTDPLSFKGICFLMSYLLVTAVMMLFVYHTWDINGKLLLRETFWEKAKYVSSCVTLFFMTSGAALLVRILPFLACNI